MILKEIKVRKLFSTMQKTVDIPLCGSYSERVRTERVMKNEITVTFQGQEYLINDVGLTKFDSLIFFVNEVSGAVEVWFRSGEIAEEKS